ncbi:MAG: hypothetical protein HN712_17370 [Gemmatimonadetes bacterium]|jgi:hypothetical protein|nr:hypothetical protein [Gemmatimonadota bacterium]MBT6146999.1 hypothetical protein [Gemmatimonadota bacterium]MBT7862090.1 hypothetical protein [Gemmatimonadota bacterium]
MTESAPPAATEPTPLGAPEPLQWRAHPWHQESPLKSTSLLAVIFIVAIVAAWSFEQMLYGIISALLLLAATSRYLLPTNFLLSQDGVAATHLWNTRRLTWQQVLRIDVHRDGLFLSPFRQPSRLDGFRGLFLRYADNGGQVAIVVDHWHQAAQTQR